MKKSVHLTEASEKYLAARFGEGGINFSAGINGAIEQLSHIARAECPALSEDEWAELYNVYAGSDLSRLALPLNVARDLLDHYGATIPEQLPEDVRDLVTTLARMTQAQQFALLDAVRVFWCKEDA